MKSSLVRFLLPLAIAVVAGLFYVRGRIGVEPPVPVNVADLDPDVSSLITKTANSVRSDRGNLQKRILLGKVYEGNELHDLAAQTYRQVLDQDETLEQIWYRYAICLEREGNLDEAIKAMDRSIAINPRFAASHWRRSMWLLDTGETNAAALAADEAVRLDNLDYSAWFAKAKVLLARRENQAAIKLIKERGLATTVNAPFANFLIGRAYQQMGQLENARPYLQEKEFRPIWRDEWSKELIKYQTGIARMRATASSQVKRGKFQQAVSLLQQIVQRDPNDTRSLNMLGVCFLQMQEFDQSLKTFKQSLKVAPDNHSTNLNYTAALLRAKQSGIHTDMREALKHAQTAIRVRPQSPKGHDAVGQVNLVMGKIDDAVAAFEKSHELDSRTPDRAIQAATAEMADNRFEAAENRLEALTATYENHSSVYIALARLYAKQVKFDEAWEMVNKASKSQICSAREQQMIRQLIKQIKPFRSKP